jgi:hypothetical protein
MENLIASKRNGEYAQDIQPPEFGWRLTTGHLIPSGKITRVNVMKSCRAISLKKFEGQDNG